MPPKAETADGSNSFLVTCIKCAKTKLEVDFDAVAKATGMSKGGAGNKFRSLMKQFAEEGAAWAKTESAGKAAPKSETNDRENDSSEEERPQMKKAKARATPKKKGIATVKDKKKIAEATASEEE